jgi:AcrR family transcriptional regulator
MTTDALTLRRRLSPGQLERRARVLSTAARLAEVGGYDAVAMKDVADGAGVALATLYRWFASKDHLLAEVLLDWMADLGTAIEVDPPTAASAAERVVEVMQRIADAAGSRPRLAAALTQALLSFDAGVWDSEIDFHSVMAAWIDTAIGPDTALDRPIRDRDAVIEVLEHVCFSSLISLARGRDTPESLGARLALTARLLLGS